MTSAGLMHTNAALFPFRTPANCAWIENLFKVNVKHYSFIEWESFCCVRSCTHTTKNVLSIQRIGEIHWKVRSAFIRIIHIVGVVIVAPPPRSPQTTCNQLQCTNKTFTIHFQKSKIRTEAKCKDSSIQKCCRNEKSRKSSTMNENWWKLLWVKECFL